MADSSSVFSQSPIKARGVMGKRKEERDWDQDRCNRIYLLILLNNMIKNCWTLCRLHLAKVIISQTEYNRFRTGREFGGQVWMVLKMACFDLKQGQDSENWVALACAKGSKKRWKRESVFPNVIFEGFDSFLTTKLGQRLGYFNIQHVMRFDKGSALSNPVCAQRNGFVAIMNLNCHVFSHFPARA